MPSSTSPVLPKFPKLHRKPRQDRIYTEDGGFVVECPVIPGCISQGDTREEALANIRDAIALCLENQPAEGWQLPEHVEVTTVAV